MGREKPCTEVTHSQELFHGVQWGSSARKIWGLCLRVLVVGSHTSFGFGWGDKLVLCCTDLYQSLVSDACQNYQGLVLITLNCTL